MPYPCLGSAEVRHDPCYQVASLVSWLIVGDIILGCRTKEWPWLIMMARMVCFNILHIIVFFFSTNILLCSIFGISSFLLTISDDSMHTQPKQKYLHKPMYFFLERNVHIILTFYQFLDPTRTKKNTIRPLVKKQEYFINCHSITVLLHDCLARVHATRWLVVSI